MSRQLSDRRHTRSELINGLSGHGPARTFSETRIHLPVQMLSVAAICAGLAFFASFVPPNAADAVLWRSIFVTAVVVGVICISWASFRVFHPVVVLELGPDSVTLRCRDFAAGWTQPWTRRYLPFERVQRIEIGRRDDYPVLRSYRGTRGYIFLLVRIAGNRRIESVYYAPLQRISRWQELIDVLRRNEQLREKVMIGDIR